ncbi:MAG: CHAT domain-containing tetratricopeptide repeat protein [Cyanobacteria bacterium J06621_15]
MIIWSKVGLISLLTVNLTGAVSILEPHPQPLSLSRRREMDVVAQQQFSSTKADSLSEQAAKYLKANQLLKAIDLWEQALILVGKTDNKSQEANILGNLAIAYNRLGNYSKAVDNNQKSLEIFRQLKIKEKEGQVLNNLGNAYQALGDYKNAIASFEKSFSIARQTNNRAEEGLILNNLGQIYINQLKHEKAIKTLQNSLQISISENDVVGQASTLIGLGSAHHVLGKLDKAKENFQTSLELAQKAKDKQREWEALGGLGFVYEDLKDYPQAIEYVEKSLAITREINNPQAEATILNNLGHTLFKAGRLTEAEKQLRQAVKLLDKLRLELDDAYQISIFDTQLHTYNLLQQILVAQNKPEEALEASEQGRARAFANLLAKKTAKDKEINSQKSFNINNPSIEQIKQIAKTQNATLVQYTLVPEDGFKHRGKLRALTEEIYIWVVKPTGEVIFRRHKFEQKTSLKSLVKSGHKCIRLRNCRSGRKESIGNTKAIENSSKNELEKLHTILIEPIADVLPKSEEEHVIFIPHEDLFLVPFATLKDSEEKYLIEKHTISTAPSIQILNFTNKLKKSVIKDNFKSALIVGNPTMPTIPKQEALQELPHSEKEARKIANLLGTNPIIGAQATKIDVMKKMPNASLIHLATHGLLDEVKELGLLQKTKKLSSPGALALAPPQENKHNGFLTSDEIAEMELQAEMVVLSACETGMGEITGDGVLGLSRAFIAAKVPTVVVSLWTVPDDATSKLMTEFYRQLSKTQNQNKAQALRKAMLKMLETETSLDPDNWAAFTLVGEAK